LGEPFASGHETGKFKWTTEPKCNMRPSDFIKGTVACATIAYVVYCYPLVSQVAVIGVLALVWLSYFYRTLISRHAR